MSSPRLSDVVKAYDVRGLVPEQLDESVCWALGSAFARIVALPEAATGVVIGRDMRSSSEPLSLAFADGAASHGLDVTLIGLCSTDGLYYASGALGQPGAMFTASHNPSRYNGIKLCRAGAKPVGQDSGLVEISAAAQELVDDGAAAAGARATGRRRGVVAERDLLAGYAGFLRGLVDLRRIRPLTAVIDAGNGMAGLTAPAVLAGLPVRVIPLYFELDGDFPNHEANPLDPRNLRDLQAAVREQGADLGLAFDGDADRCFVVDERGQPVSPSAITALVADREIAAQVALGTPANQVSVVFNVICSHAVPEVIAEAGAQGVRTRVGHSFIKAEMARHDAVFGGEHSAHYYFRDFWHADTGMLAALHILAALGEQPGPLSLLVAGYARYAASGEINSAVADVGQAMGRVTQWAQARSVALDRLDGLTVEHRGNPMWWFSLRPSNTEPLLRLNVEAGDQATMEQIRDEVLAQVRAPAAEPQGGSASSTAAPEAAAVLPGWLRDLLRCPVCRRPLTDAAAPDGRAELQCAPGCDGPGRRRGYRIDDGVPVLLAEEARVFTA